MSKKLIKPIDPQILDPIVQKFPVPNRGGMGADTHVRPTGVASARPGIPIVHALHSRICTFVSKRYTLHGDLLGEPIGVTPRPLGQWDG